MYNRTSTCLLCIFLCCSTLLSADKKQALRATPYTAAQCHLLYSPIVPDRPAWAVDPMREETLMLIPQPQSQRHKVRLPRVCCNALLSLCTCCVSLCCYCEKECCDGKNDV